MTLSFNFFFRSLSPNQNDLLLTPNLGLFRHCKQGVVPMLIASAFSLMPVSAYAQIKTIPAKKAIQDVTGKLYVTADAACAVRALPYLQNGNFTRTDSISCAPYGPMTKTQVLVTTLLGAKFSTSNPAQYSCLLQETDSLTLTGDPRCQQPVNWSQTVQYEEESLGVVSVCDKTQGWQHWDAYRCYKPDTPYVVDRGCPECGNPTSVGSGSKHETYGLGSLPSGSVSIPIELRYGNQFDSGGGTMLGEPSWFLEPADRRLNLLWMNASTDPRIIASQKNGISEVYYVNSDGTYRSFDPQTTLQMVASQWIRTDYLAELVEMYDSIGRLTRLRYFSGGGFDLTYPSGTALLPNAMTSTTGRSVAFSYTNDRLTGIQLPDGKSVVLQYKDYQSDANNIRATYLSSIVYPDLSYKTFAYIPGMTLPAIAADLSLSADGKEMMGIRATDSGMPSYSVVPVESDEGRAFFNLSGVVDENANAFSSFTYDDNGHVKVSQHAGSVYRYSFNYLPGETDVTDPLGTVSAFYLNPVNQQTRLTGVTKTAQNNYSRSTTISYDAAGNVVKSTDSATLAVECIKIDANLNREVLRLNGATSCPADLSTYVVANPGSNASIVEHLTTTQWHPIWRIKTRIAEPKLITTLVYNGQPDPTAGNAVASCAPAGAYAYGSEPIAVLCKRVEQATSDETGSAGFTATAAGTARIWKYTYNQYGQVLTATGPRTDVNDGTTYSYYTTTSFDTSGYGHAVGDLQTITDASGQVTTYTSYDQAGRVHTLTRPSGATAEYLYNERGWLLTEYLSHNSSNSMNSYTYDNVGQLKTATLSDGLVITYTYDAAHRLTGVSDNRGNTITYTLDAAGNRLKEEVKGAGSVLARRTQRVFDQLGRLQNVAVE